ncbi:nuclease [Desulfovibrio psychrotolerans]|uniref:Nuclease n=1 Tax=Desulfovibrio psychrotolerans TaxID=415242 RepID=A0A7J0BPF0_9BACT|nr:nuclease [Desulfovibrio psychrotolerans]
MLHATHALHVLLALGILLLTLPLGADAAHGVVHFVPDGDTVVLEGSGTVRLAGIDSPEMGRDGTPDQHFAEAARTRLAELVGGRQIVLASAEQVVRMVQAGSVVTGSNGRGGPSASSDFSLHAISPGKLSGLGEKGLLSDLPRDRYGRFLAVILLPDGRNVNELLVREGAAMAYFVSDGSDAARTVHDRMVTLQRQAMREKLGMWAGLADKITIAGPFIGNRRSMRFFPAACADAGRISPKNRVAFRNVEEAFEAGYSPARHCGVWPLSPGR